MSAPRPETDPRRRYAGGPPFEEVWFLEGSLDARRALWLRYTLSDRGGSRVQAIWAAIVEDGRIVAARSGEALQHPVDGLYVGSAGTLSPGVVQGQLGEVGWDLSIAPGAAGYAHVPQRLSGLGLTSRHYASLGQDLRISGTVRCGDRVWDVASAPAVLGHIWGRRSNARRWAWAWCAAFDGSPDAVFEGISIRLGTRVGTLPWATSLMARHGGELHTLTRARRTFAIRSEVEDDRWRFVGRSGAVELTGEARLPSDGRVVRVRYLHADGEETWVRNSPLASLTLRIRDRRSGRDVTLRSQRASFEIAGRTPLDQPLHLDERQPG